VAVLIEKMINKSPRQRHDDMSQVIVDLDTVKERLEGGYADAETGTFIRVLSDIFTNWRTG